MNKRNVLFLLVLILILGAFLRIYKLGSESFWIDEMETIYAVQQESFPTVLKNIYQTGLAAPQYYDEGDTGAMPLNFLFSYYWTKIFGLSEFKLRLLSALFGIGSLYLIFLIGKMMFDQKTGLLAAFILSINYMHIYYSQEARSYSLLVFLTLLTVYFLLRILKENKAYDLLFILSGSLLAYTHYFGFFILFFEFVYFLAYYKSHLKSIIISYAGIFVLYLPWLPALLKQASKINYLSVYFGNNTPFSLAKVFVQLNSWFSPDLETRIALRASYHSLQNFSPSLSGVTLLGWLSVICVLLITLIFTLFFIISVFKNNKASMDRFKDKKYLFLLMWFLIPIAIPVAITLMFPSSPLFGYVQYTLFASPAYYLIVSKGITKFKKQWLWLIALLIILSAAPLYSYYANFDKQQWKEAASYLKSNRIADELVVTSASTNVLPLGYYYSSENVMGIKNVDELKSNIENKDSVWLVYASEVYFDPQNSIKNYLDSKYKLDKNKEFTGIKIFHYVK